MKQTSTTPEPQEILELFGKRSSVIKPGLDRIRSAWNQLGRPGATTPTILVAGTNGKGSTSGLLWHMLAANGLKSGFFSSPHLTEFRERIAVSDQETRNSELVETLHEIKTTLTAAVWDELSFFEINTLLALKIFAARKTEVNVLEVGLGGRLDCTNMVDPLVSVITSIGVDHTEFLGSDTTSIAWEKAGIMRSGRACLWGGLVSADQKADEVIRKAAKDQNVSLKIANEHFFIKSISYFTTDSHKTYTLPSRVQKWPNFLQRNFVMAAAAFQEFTSSKELPDTLKQKNISLDVALARFGDPKIPWPITLTGRFHPISLKHEKTSETVRLLIDVCHNPHGAKALAKGLEETGIIPAGESRPAMLCILSDKDDSGIWQALEGKISEAFLFKIPSDRSWSQESTKIPATMFDSFDACFSQAMSRKELRIDSQQPWLICGSVAAVGEVFKYFKSHHWNIS